MRWCSVVLLLPVLSCTSIPSKMEQIVPVPHEGVVAIRPIGPPSSDFIHLEVEFRPDHTRERITYPLLVGPILVSKANRQLVSCEANGAVEGLGPAVYDLRGSLLFARPHVGFLRSCGMTDDERLYWFHYNLVRSGRPINRVVVLDSEGLVVVDAESLEATEAEFVRGTKKYVIPVSAPDWPG